MELDLAQEIASYDDELRLYEDYSGKGMCGKTTHGVVGQHDLLRDAVESHLKRFYMKDTPDEFIDEFIDNFRSDSLGLDIIWY